MNPNLTTSYFDNPKIKLTRIYPISYYTHYNESLEYSDKLIVPPAVIIPLKQLRIPLPPVLSISLSKSNSLPIICGVFEYTAKEDCLYCPSWMLKKLSSPQKKPPKEVILEILRPKRNNNCVFPAATRVEIATNTLITLDNCKKGLLQYTILNKGEWIRIKAGSTVARVFISNLFPKDKCMIKSLDFSVRINESFVTSLALPKDPLDINPIIESIQIPLIRNAVNRSRDLTPTAESYFKAGNRPLRFEALDNFDTGLVPWEKEDQIRFENQGINDLLQPEIPVQSLLTEIKPQKPATFAFPQLKTSKTRAVQPYNLTTPKAVSFSTSKRVAPIPQSKGKNNSISF
jgi:hypothetical protein